MQICIKVIDFLYFLAPPRVFVYLVYEEPLSSNFYKFICYIE